MTRRRAALYGLLAGCVTPPAVALAAFAYGRAKWGWR